VSVGLSVRLFVRLSVPFFVCPSVRQAVFVCHLVAVLLFSPDGLVRFLPSRWVGPSVWERDFRDDNLSGRLSSPSLASSRREMRTRCLRQRQSDRRRSVRHCVSKCGFSLISPANIHLEMCVIDSFASVIVSRNVGLLWSLKCFEDCGLATALRLLLCFKVEWIFFDPFCKHISKCTSSIDNFASVIVFRNAGLLWFLRCLEMWIIDGVASVASSSWRRNRIAAMLRRALIGNDVRRPHDCGSIGCEIVRRPISSRTVFFRLHNRFVFSVLEHRVCRLLAKKNWKFAESAIMETRRSTRRVAR